MTGIAAGASLNQDNESWPDRSPETDMQAALSETERKLSTLMGNLPGMAYRRQCDAAWTLDFVSQGSVELTGYQPVDLAAGGRISFSAELPPRYFSIM